MSEENTRLVRLTAISTQLQSKRIITAREIADKHGVSVRTVYRDIRTLQDSGIPITMEDGKGYKLVEGYQLPPVAFTQEEANALITSEHIILNNNDGSLVEHYESALLKIKSVLKYSQMEKTELLEQRLQVRDYTKQNHTSDLLMSMQSALTGFQVVEIRYISLNNNESTREIEPFAIFNARDNWIVVAYCLLRNEFRSFRLDCIQSMQLVGRGFEPHQITLEEYFEKCRENWGHP